MGHISKKKMKYLWIKKICMIFLFAGPADKRANQQQWATPLEPAQPHLPASGSGQVQGGSSHSPEGEGTPLHRGERATHVGQVCRLLGAGLAGLFWGYRVHQQGVFHLKGKILSIINDSVVYWQGIYDITKWKLFENQESLGDKTIDKIDMISNESKWVPKDF